MQHWLSSLLLLGHPAGELFTYDQSNYTAGATGWINTYELNAPNYTLAFNASDVGPTFRW